MGKLSGAIGSLNFTKHADLLFIEDTRYQLSYMTNFALLLFVQSSSMAVTRENKLLLDKWRNTVRMQSRAWPVLKLAVMRLDAVVWKGLDSIVSWAGKDSPAEVLQTGAQ